MSTSLNTLFNPRSVAVIGASGQKGKVGYALMQNICAGAQRNIYPITLNEQEIFGLQVHRSVLDVHEPIDCAIIAVRADLVASVLRECAQKDIHSAVVISAGFKEVGEEGKKMEEQIAAIAKEHDIALLGPNCLGIIDAHADFNASFAVEKPLKGSVAFLSQSGALGTALLDWSNSEGLGFSKFVSLGNEASLSELPFMEYIADDENTKAVLMYLEKVTDGPRFLELARKITDKKPLVILHAGKSARGGSAVMSHTGSLAPEGTVFSSACKQSGAIVVNKLAELFSFAKLFSMGFLTPKRRLAVVTNGGGPSINATDLIDLSESLELTVFPRETWEELKKVLPPMASVGNPVDLIGDASSLRYDAVLKILTAKNDIDAILFLVTPQMMTDEEAIARVLVMHAKEKPIIPVFMGGKSIEPAVKVLRENGLVNFVFPSDVVSVLDLFTLYPEKKNVLGVGGASTRLAMVPMEEMRPLLSTYGVYLDGALMRTKEEINDALWSIGAGPFVIKAISKELVHKSDLHAVKVNLSDAKAVEQAWSEIETEVHEHSPNAHIDDILVQRMSRGKEVIIGMKRDAVFGPIVVFGLGGIFVEILKDVSMRVAPVSKQEAIRQIQEIKGYELLSGIRGEAPVNIDALADIIVNISRLALEHPEVEEIDLNPVIVTQERAVVVDARLMRK